jgi:dTDP-4-dehydrorhamnose 3,5-epimerase-like enzyme
MPDLRAVPEVTVSGCQFIDFQIISDQRGNLAVVEGGRELDFDIARVFFIYDVPGGADRAGHAHHELHEVLIAISGSFDVVLDDGITQQRCQLNRSHRGLHVPPMVWRHLDNFSSNSVCLVLASEVFNESDYIRDHEEFSRLAAELRQG